MISKQDGGNKQEGQSGSGWMGGDYAPTEVVSGAARAVKEMDVKVINYRHQA